MTISAFLPVFNEEKRIESALESLMWCDEIILVDKHSTDRTVEIASSFGNKVKIYSVKNTEAYDVSEIDVFLKNSISEWAILFTASNIIHPNLTLKIREKICDANFDYDVLHIPIRRFVLGIDSKRSPWHSELTPIVLRKSAFSLNKKDVHGAIQKVGRQFKFKYDSVECLYHLTHGTVDKMMDNHLRYWRGESKTIDIDLKKSLKDYFKSMFNIIIKKKTFLLGYDGIALIFSFLTYQMMVYVYKWEVMNNKSENVYNNLRDNITKEWDRIKQTK
jgi:glycosyltransferase involved in cell wall biosynthesis